MDTNEYRRSDDPQAGATSLLDDSGQPRVDIAADDRALARVAAAIHGAARTLTASQIEQVIRWLKTLKHEGAGHKASAASRRDMRRFFEVLEDLRESPDQQRLGWVAYRETLGARTMAAIAAAILVILAGLWSLEFSRIWVGAAIIVPIYLLYKSDRMSVAALEKAKLQDRTYALRSLYAAQSIDELDQAGLFMHVPALEHVKFPDWAHNRAEFREVMEGLRDAVYHDPERVDP